MPWRWESDDREEAEHELTLRVDYSSFVITKHHFNMCEIELHRPKFSALANADVIRFIDCSYQNFMHFYLLYFNQIPSEEETQLSNINASQS